MFFSLWLVASAATDVCIAGALIWQFKRLETHFASTDSLIHRLIVATIRSGAVTSLIALITFSLFVANKESNFDVGLSYSLGRAYTLTLLANLNSRSSTRRTGLNGEELSENLHSVLPVRGNTESRNMTGIHVIRTVLVKDDVSAYHICHRPT
jgi:hypothetical protein